MGDSRSARAGQQDVLRTVDGVIRSQGIEPTHEIRSLLAAAAEQRIRDRGEPFEVAVRRAMASLAATARVRH